MYRTLLLPGLILVSSVAAAHHAAEQGCSPRDVTRCERAYEQRDFARAHQICRPLADVGSAVAQFVLGIMYQEGEGVRLDGDAAVIWYAKAAEQGHVEAQFNLGTMYRYGRGVWLDYVEAFAWFDIAAEGRHPDALRSRGIVARRLSPTQLANAERRAARLRGNIEIARAPHGGPPDEAPDTGLRGDDRVQELVDRLRPIIEQADRERSAKPRVIRQLRDLVGEYDWPWRVTLLDDNFRDGDFTTDPAWTIIGGNFRVERRTGLRTEYTPRRRRSDSRSSEDELSSRLFGAIVTEVLRDRNRGDRRRLRQAEIHTKLGISNAFVVRVELTAFDTARGRGTIRFGPYQGLSRDTGYQLEYNSGNRAFLQILRIFPGGSSVVEFADLKSQFEDGRRHILEWRRDREGEMVVLVDGEEVMRARDRGMKHAFDGFTLVNAGGEYGIRRITLSGTGQ